MKDKKQAVSAVERGASGGQHHIGLEAIHTCWDATLPPGIVVDPGETVVFATREPSQGLVARDLRQGVQADGLADLIALVAASDSAPAASGRGTELGGHALTGPVAINGAEPGDALIVDVLSVVPTFWGWTACGPGEGALLHDELTDWTLHLWDLHDKTHAVFLPGIRVPMEPFCGVLGVAPSEPGPHRAAPPRRVGGNLDIRHLTAGSTLKLPVEVAGALFSCGDVHAAQGDGEVAGTGIEIDAVVTVRLSLEKGRAPSSPEFIAPDPPNRRGPWFVAVGSDTDPKEAARIALRGILSYMQEDRGLTLAQGIVLSSACVDLRVSQLVNAGTWTISAS